MVTQLSGAIVSFTVTVKEHIGPDCIAQVTVVVPFGNAEPVGGLQLTTPQEPVVEGAG